MVATSNHRRNKNRLFKLSAVGGTFSLLHRGHEVLLRLAFSLSEGVIIGITSNYFISRHPKAHEVKEYEERLRDLYRFLLKNRLLRRSVLIPLVDGLGPLLDRNDIQCVVVTTETYNSIKGVNSTRRRLGLKKLSVVILGLILAEDGKPIRTTRIVKGEIDRTGRVVGSRG